ncbi:HAD family hydrolase [uncultured Algimonas sp.]|uniref:HAD family hydrolase n=1 Tax=uncultured Algimonas sp. TaxID=1547920 RepID=UPI002624A988|nr:HAD family hydrolase [uncultured Algimonas sp.]
MIQRRTTDLVIFDCDGVLVDSEPISNAVMAEHITRLGWPMKGAESVRRFKGRTMAQVHAVIECRLGRAVDPAWRAAFHREQEDRMRTELRPVPGIKALIGRVHAAGLDSCVASQGRHEKMAISLGATGLLEVFAGRIFSAVDVARPKPHPDLFLHAARQMQADPSHCVVIEDSPTGIEGALAAGMHVIGYDPDRTGLLDADGVTVVKAMDGIRIS